MPAMNTNHHRRSIRLKGYDYSQPGGYFVTLVTHDRQNLFGDIIAGEMHLNEFGEIAYEQWLQIPARFDLVELGEFVIMPNHFHGILIIHESVGAGFTPARMESTGKSPFGQPQNGQPQNGQPRGLPLQVHNPVGAGFTRAHVPAQMEETGHPQNGQPQNGQPQGLPLQEACDFGEIKGLPRRVTLGNVVGAYKSLVANECLKIYNIKNESMGKIWQRNYHEHIIRSERELNQIGEYILSNPARWDSDGENKEMFVAD